MANKRPIGKHTDTGFVSGFGRYCLAERLLECESWEKVEKVLTDSRAKARLLSELRLRNAILVIEYMLISFMERNVKKSKMTSLKQYLLDCLKRYRDLHTLSEAILVLQSEGGCNEVNKISPHIFFHVCGLGLGNLIHIVRDFCANARNKQEILKELNILNESRTILVHDVCSSRIDAIDEINKGITAALKLKVLLAGG